MFSLEWSLNRFKPHVALQTFRMAAAGALYVVAEATMTRAKELCPVDTGALRDTGHVRRPTIVGNLIEVRFGFGGPAAPYAVYVHENLTAHHKVGQAKFAEAALMERAATLVPDVRLEMRARLATAA